MGTKKPATAGKRAGADGDLASRTKALSQALQNLFQETAAEPLPEDLQAILDQLDQTAPRGRDR